MLLTNGIHDLLLPATYKHDLFNVLNFLLGNDTCHVYEAFDIV